MRLTQRERMLIIGSTLLIAAWSAYAFTVKPAIARLETLERIIPEKQNELARLRSGSDEYIRLKSEMESLRAKVAAQTGQFEPLTFVDSIVRQSGLTDNLDSMKPATLPLESDYSEKIVQINMSKLTLSELIDFLIRVQSSEFLLKVSTLHIKKNAADPNLFDSVIIVSSVGLTRH